MPWAQFWVMYQQIDPLQADEDLRALSVTGVGANPGEKGKQYKKLAKALEKRAGVDKAKVSTAVPGATSLAVVEAKPGSIAAQREKQRLANEEINRKRREHERRKQESAVAE